MQFYNPDRDFDNHVLHYAPFFFSYFHTLFFVFSTITFHFITISLSLKKNFFFFSFYLPFLLLSLLFSHQPNNAQQPKIRVSITPTDQTKSGKCRRRASKSTPSLLPYLSSQCSFWPTPTATMVHRDATEYGSTWFWWWRQWCS